MFKSALFRGFEKCGYRHGGLSFYFSFSLYCFLSLFFCFSENYAFFFFLSSLSCFLRYNRVFAKTLALGSFVLFPLKKYQLCTRNSDKSKIWGISAKTAPHQLTGTPQGYSSVSFAGEAICRLYCRVLFLMHKWNFFFSAWCYFHFNSAIMLKKSHFFEDRQAVSVAFCLWCNSVLNSLKFVRGTFFVQTQHQVICEKSCIFLTCLQL